jgi:predicted amidophosphoribosyltransferase
MVRSCRRCDTEFHPHVVRCSDCGGELEDHYPDATAASQAPVQEETTDAAFVTVATDLSAGKAELVARRLGSAGIQFRVGARGYGFVLAVRAEDQPATRQILLRARAIPREPLEDQPAVAETGGPCPACGDPVAAGSVECPSCGLSLSSEAAVCDRCGAELVPPWEPCKHCAGAVPGD